MARKIVVGTRDLHCYCAILACAKLVSALQNQSEQGLACPHISEGSSLAPMLAARHTAVTVLLQGCNTTPSHVNGLS